MPKDPVCGMNVDRRGGMWAMYEGKAYYFCSQSCKKRFEANPAQYVKK